MIGSDSDPDVILINTSSYKHHEIVEISDDDEDCQLLNDNSKITTDSNNSSRPSNFPAAPASSIYNNLFIKSKRSELKTKSTIQVKKTNMPFMNKLQKPIYSQDVIEIKPSLNFSSVNSMHKPSSPYWKTNRIVETKPKFHDQPAISVKDTKALYDDDTDLVKNILKLADNIKSLPVEVVDEIELGKLQPDEMFAKLKPHQLVGLKWLLAQENGSDKGGILADGNIF
jgi:hypothetical protein